MKCFTDQLTINTTDKLTCWWFLKDGLVYEL